MTIFHVPAGQPVQQLIDSGMVKDGDTLLLGAGRHSGFTTRGLDFTVSSAAESVIDSTLELFRVEAELAVRR